MAGPYGLVARLRLPGTGPAAGGAAHREILIDRGTRALHIGPPPPAGSGREADGSGPGADESGRGPDGPGRGLRPDRGHVIEAVSTVVRRIQVPAPEVPTPPAGHRRGRVRRFLSELRRRHVFRVLIPYAIGAWVLIQVAETTFPYIGLPDEAVTIAIVLAVLGFPVAALLAWIFDITPEGVRATAALQPEHDRPPASAGETAAGTPAKPATGTATGTATETVPGSGQEDAAPSPAPGSIIPTPPSPLIGRDAELAGAEELLRQDDSRVLTLLGSAGTGKTRLALEIAHRMASRYRDGARWVHLGGTTDPELVLSRVGQALGVGEAGTQPLPGRVADALAGRELLLALDNLEHLLLAAPAIADLVASAPGLTVLVTSRAPLRIRGERVFPVGPLPSPDPEDDAERLRASPAVRLFAERARDADPGFRLDDDQLPAVAEICRRLDGLPLAIELAAVRVNLLTPDAMLARLDRRLPLLTGGPRDLPARHRTLREAIAWSHDLLEDAERRVLHRLSTFAGGCGLEAAETVCGEPEGPPTLDLLQGLVDHSLVRRTGGADGEARLSMLETIREYAADRLSEDGAEEERARARHLSYYRALAQEAEQKLVGHGQAAWLDRLEQEHDNFRAAMAWTLDTDRHVEGLGLAVALWRLWDARGHLSEGRRWIDWLLVGAGAAPTRLRIRALYAAGVLADAQEDYDAAETCFRETLELNRAEGDRWGVANALNNVGVMALRRGDHAAAHALYEESVRLWREIGNDAAVDLALSNLGNVARLRGDHGEARRLLQESLTRYRGRDDQNGCALSLGLLADVARDEGDGARAGELYQESLDLFLAVGNMPQAARSLLELGRVELAGSRGESLAHLSDSLRLSAQLGNPRAVADALDALADWAAAAPDPAGAATTLAQAAAAMRARPGGRSLQEAPPVRVALEWAESQAATPSLDRNS
jgi:predicted ATPase